MSIGIFILPIGSLNDELIRWKERIEEEHQGHPYTLHPPHMTLINLEVINKEDSVDVASIIASNIQPFQISVKSKDVFWDDNITGGHTLYFRVENNDNLFNIQKSLAESLVPFKKKISPNDKIIKITPFYESFNKYGSPFIGKHWIPHFSVTSLRTKKTNPLITNFLTKIPNYTFTINEISIWHINGDEHIKLKTIALQ
jgi:2'-5' RNA ligase